MNRYLYDILFGLTLSAVFVIINVMAFISKAATDYLYLLELTYAIGNRFHFVALSISE